MSYEMKECEKRIRQVRIKSGLTQEAVAKALNVDQSYYGRIETGKRGCPVNIFVQLSDLFGVSLDYLILGKFEDDVSNNAEGALLKSEIETLVEHLELFKRYL